MFRILQFLLLTVSVLFVPKIGNTANYYDDLLVESTCRKRNWDNVTYALSKGADINVYGGEALKCASYYMKKIYYIKKLLEYGADVNLINKKGETALMWASRSDSCTDNLQILLENGANVNIKDLKGKTALMYASEDNNIRNITRLIENNADLNMKDNNGKTALMYAIENITWYVDPRKTILALLNNSQIDINIKDRNDRTALFYAIFRYEDIRKNEHNEFCHYCNESILIIEELLKRGANPTILDNTRRMPADYTSDSVIEHLLQKYGSPKYTPKELKGISQKIIWLLIIILILLKINKQRKSEIQENKERIDNFIKQEQIPPAVVEYLRNNMKMERMHKVLLNMKLAKDTLGLDYIKLLPIFADLKYISEKTLCDAKEISSLIKFPLEEIFMLLKILDSDCNAKIMIEEVFKHYQTLKIKKNQLIYNDDYGNEICDDFYKEIGYFLKNVVFKDVDNYEINSSDLTLVMIVFTFISMHIEKQNTIVEQTVETGIDYENLVYNKLQDSGFEVQKTPTTGDQGVDLIASKNGKRCAIQCKFYSSAVGNKAVQEVIAGKGYYSCEYAVVCSNNDFTKSARQLANNQGVILASEMNIVEKINELFSAPNSEKSTSNIKEEIESDFKDDVEENYIMENFIK